MTREEALKSMTIWAAFAGFQEQLTGSLTPPGGHTDGREACGDLG